MKKNIYTKPYTKVTHVEMESLLASMSSNDKLPGKDSDNNQFSKNHKYGTSLWDETWDDDDDDDETK